MFDRVGISAARRLDQDLAGRRAAGPVSTDPYLAGWLGQFQASGFRVESGTVVDAVPGGAAYLVDAGQASVVWCSPGGTAAGFGAWGARPLHGFPIGSFVIFVRHPQTPTIGTILAAEPPWVAHTAFHPADGVWPFTRSGHRVETAHQFPVRASEAVGLSRTELGGGVDLPDLSAGRPIDATAVGEWGAMAETGVGVYVDPFQAYLRVDEATGIFAFYPDQVLRVAGHNYQHFTSHAEHEEYDDAGELGGVTRRCVYPWETPGLWRPNQVTPVWQANAAPNHGLAPGQGTKFVDPLVSQDGSGDAVREPERYDQLPAARLLEWFGYLGQGGRRAVALPAQLDQLIASPGAREVARTADLDLVAAANAPAGRVRTPDGTGPQAIDYEVPPNNRTAGPDQPGVLEVTQSLTGGYRVRSARHIILAKRPSIPVPRQKLRPEDPAGDTPLNYQSSGWSKFGAGGDGSGDGGTGSAHRVAYGLAADEGSPQRACMLPEALAYLFNWETLAPFAYHAGDWAVAQEGAAGTAVVNQRPPNYLALETDQYLDSPSPVLVDVDHRYGHEVPVYENESHLALLDDGTVVIGDGWGSEIRMTGGNIEFHAAGDVSFFPGRNVLSWAGHDVILRAHDSIDLSAANGDLRTKAERNSHHLAGNNGCGGFVFEAKSVCAAHRYEDRVGEEVTSSGFVVLAPNAQFSVLAGDAAVVLAETSSDGRIYFDAGRSRHIHSYSKTFVNRISADGSVVHLFDGSGISPEPGANEFAAGYTLLTTDLMLRQDLYVSGSARVGRRVTARGAVIERSDADFSAARLSVTSRTSYLVTDFRRRYNQEVSFPPHADEAEFTCRTVGQYLSTDYQYWQPRWRSVADAGEQTFTAWTEPAVYGRVSGAETLPHPGGRWTEDEGYRWYNFTLVDGAAGWVAVDRDDPINRQNYEDALVSSPENTGLADTYTVPVPAGTG